MALCRLRPDRHPPRRRGFGISLRVHWQCAADLYRRCRHLPAQRRIYLHDPLLDTAPAALFRRLRRAVLERHRQFLVLPDRPRDGHRRPALRHAGPPARGLHRSGRRGRHRLCRHVGDRQLDHLRHHPPIARLRGPDRRRRLPEEYGLAARTPHQGPLVPVGQPGPRHPSGRRNLGRRLFPDHLASHRPRSPGRHDHPALCTAQGALACRRQLPAFLGSQARPARHAACLRRRPHVARGQEAGAHRRGRRRHAGRRADPGGDRSVSPASRRSRAPCSARVATRSLSRPPIPPPSPAPSPNSPRR